MASREALPVFVPPMLARTGEIQVGANWASELKLDGFRLQVRVDRGRVSARTRPGRDCTNEIAEALAELGGALSGRRVLLDGELVCLDASGSPDFEALRAQLRPRSRTVP